MRGLAAGEDINTKARRSESTGNGASGDVERSLEQVNYL